MNEQLFAQSISPLENKPRNQKNRKQNVSLTRRDFIKGAAAFTAGVAIGIKTLDSSKNQQYKSTKKAIAEEKIDIYAKKRTQVSEEIQKIREQYVTPSRQQEKIEFSDKDSIGKTFSQQLETQNSITLNTETRKAIYSHWIKEYRDDKINYQDGLVAGLERMKPWSQDIKQKFKDFDLPEELMYLAIAESHFDMDATSSKSATGPYQITPETSKNYDLIVNLNYDERRDPVRSAEVCAKYLHEHYKKFGGLSISETRTQEQKQRNQDAMQLALMAYNGGYVNKYIKYLNKKDQEATPHTRAMHVVKKGDSLSKIADEYNTSVILLRKANFGKKELSQEKINNLKIDSTLIIPQERTTIALHGFNKWLESRINQEIKKKIKPVAENRKRSKSEIKKIINIINSYHENINYPDKFFAIIDIIKEDNLSKIIKEKKSYKEILPPKTNITHFEYEVKRGDTLSKIAKIIKKQYPQCPQQTFLLQAMLIRANGNTSKIKSGQKITLDFPLKRPAILADIAQKYGTNLTRLRDLNPAIKKDTLILSPKIKIRVPT